MSVSQNLTKYIEKMNGRSESERDRTAVVLSVSITVVILIMWVMWNYIFGLGSSLPSVSDLNGNGEGSTSNYATSADESALSGESLPARRIEIAPKNQDVKVVSGFGVIQEGIGGIVQSFLDIFNDTSATYQR